MNIKGLKCRVKVYTEELLTTLSSPYSKVLVTALVISGLLNKKAPLLIGASLTNQTKIFSY